jgi:hypothetical protein
MELRRTARIVIAAAVMAALLGPVSAASAQSSQEFKATGEKYWIDFSFNWWLPALGGSVASDALGLIGSTIDFASDLGFSDTREQDLRLVLRPAKKHKFRFQYTPTAFSASSVLTRDISFQGTIYPVSLPVESALTWNVMRFGYEWDFFYRPRGYVGVLFEIRHTTMDAAIDSIVGSGQVEASGPFPSIGVVTRVNATKHLAINAEFSTLKLSDLIPDQDFWLLDLDISATYNLARYFGVSGGWRRQNTSLQLAADRGDINFKGFWIGGTVRY